MNCKNAIAVTLWELQRLQDYCNAFAIAFMGHCNELQSNAPYCLQLAGYRGLQYCSNKVNRP